MAAHTTTSAKTTTKPVTQHKRRPHKKSRHGCGSCKKFHVKCDESGPPCGNCILRQVPCEYPTLKGTKGNRSPSLAAYSNHHSDSTSSRASTPSQQCLSQHPSMSLSPWGSERLLELELMHRWCTRTYTGFVAVPEDAYYCMGVLPRLALEYSDVLLSTIMALAALDTAMASTTESSRSSYANIAMQYYDKASAAFRDPALSPTPDNHHILVFVSAMLVIFNLAVSQVTTTSLQSKELGGGRIQVGMSNSGSSRSSKSRLAQIEVTFGLLTSSYQLAQKHMDWLLDSPWTMRTIMSLGEASPDMLDKEHKAVFTRLRLLNRKLHSQAAAVVAGNNNTRQMASQESTMAAYSTGPMEDSIFVCSSGEQDDSGYDEMSAVMDMIDPRIIQNTHHDFATVAALAANARQHQQHTPPQPKLKMMGMGTGAPSSLQPAADNNYMQTQADVDVSFDYYQKAIAHLERFYAEDARDAVRCFLLAYPTLARRDMEAASAEAAARGNGGFTPWEPLELLLLAHWALLLHRMGRLFWWVGSSGRDLVTACSDALEYNASGVGGGAAGAGGIEWEEAVAWVRRQVSLPPLQTGGLWQQQWW
ncbi:C6 transcription factor [Apiospora rasikravindrae]|uniref:C6 transcription factor n=1 Tax=Apiospora rasikravindrae TaxID=990691 RepID=A0ABR1TZJ2_9PEZI